MDDSIDFAYLETDPNFDPPESRFVMTSWHEDESLEDISHFFALLTRFDEFEPENFLILGIGVESEEIVSKAASMAEARLNRRA